MQSEQEIKLILKYLRQHHLIQSFLTLQQQSEIKYFSYNKQIDFFKKILLRGDFSEAAKFINTFESRIEEKEHKKILLDLYKQKLYELIENPDETQLRNLFEKQLVMCCNQQQYQQFFSYLTFRSVKQVPNLQGWTILKGRYDCFEVILPYLQVFSSVIKDTEIQDRLELIIESYYQQLKKPTQQFKIQKEKYQIENRQDKGLQARQKYYAEEINAQQVEYQSDKKKKKKNLVELEPEQKQQIKKSILNMNLSQNIYGLKDKISLSSLQNKKHQQDLSISKIEKSQLIDKIEKSQFVDKIEKSQFVDKNMSQFEKSQATEKRSRVNASLNGPMNNRQRLEGSVKVDNLMKKQNQQIKTQSKLFKRQNNDGENIQEKGPTNIGGYSLLNKSKFDKNNNIYLQKAQANYNELESSQINEISEEEQSDTIKSTKINKDKYSYLSSQQQLEEEVKRNIEYLEQTSSVLLKHEEEQQNFTFSQHGDEVKVTKAVKLAVIHDSKAIRTCQFSPTGNYFALGTNSSILRIFDVRTLLQSNYEQELQPLYQIDNLHLKSIFCLDWSANQRSLVTCSNDLQVKVTQLNNNYSEHKATLIGRHDSCVRMAKLASKDRIISCGDDSVIKVWDTGKLKKCTVLKAHTNSVSAFKLTQNQNLLFSVSKDMTIRKWDLRTGDSVAVSKLQESQLTYIANNTDKIIVSHKNGNVSFFTNDLQLEHAVQIHEEEIRSIEALRNSNMLLTASFDGHVGLFNQKNSHSPNYFQHNQLTEDKVVYATFLHNSPFKGFASTSTQGLCHIYSYS